MKKNLLIITSSYPRFLDDDITGRFMQDYAIQLQKEYNVYVLAPYTKSSLKEEILEGVHVTRFTQCIFGVEFAYGDGLLTNIKNAKWKILFLPLFFINLYFSILKMIQNKNIHILHPHWMIPQAFVCAFIRKKIPVVGFSHGTDLLGLNGIIGTQIKKIALSKLNALIVTNDELKRKAQSIQYTKPILVQGLGVDTDMFHSKKRVEQKDYKQVLYAGAFIETKGIIELITAVSTVKHKISNIKLTMIGYGNLKNIIEELCLKNDIKYEIIESLKHKELSVYMASADLFVLPSYSEGFSMVVAEAMSSMTPVVMTENIGIAQIMNQMNIKVIEQVKLKNVNDLSDKIFQVLTEPKDLEKLNRGREFIEKNYSWNEIGHKFCSFIKENTN